MYLFCLQAPRVGIITMARAVAPDALALVLATTHPPLPLLHRYAMLCQTTWRAALVVERRMPPWIKWLEKIPFWLVRDIECYIGVAEMETLYLWGATRYTLDLYTRSLRLVRTYRGVSPLPRAIWDAEWAGD